MSDTVNNGADDAANLAAQQPNFATQPMAAGTVFTGTQKAGWFCVGMLLGIPGIIIASLANVNHPDRSKATMMAAIGVGAMVALTVAISLIFSFTLLYILTIAISVAG